VHQMLYRGSYSRMETHVGCASIMPFRLDVRADDSLPSKLVGLSHERQERQHVGRIATIVSGCPTGRRKDAARLAQPKRPAADASSRCDLLDEQPVFHGGSIGLAPWGNVKTLRETRDLSE
jgi:hypothetical protein